MGRVEMGHPARWNMDQCTCGGEKSDVRRCGKGDRSEIDFGQEDEWGGVQRAQRNRTETNGPWTRRRIRWWRGCRSFNGVSEVEY